MKHHPTRVCALPQRPLTCVTVLPPLQPPPHAANGNPSFNGTAPTNGSAPSITANGSSGNHSDSNSDSGSGSRSGSEGCVLILSASAAQLDFWRLPPPTPSDEVTLHEDSFHER